MKKRILILNLILILSINTTFAFSFGFSSFWSKVKSFFSAPKIVSVQTIATTAPIISASTTNNREIKKIKKEDTFVSKEVTNNQQYGTNIISSQASTSVQSEFITLQNGDMKNIKTGQIFKGVASQVAEAKAKADALNVINNPTVQKQALLSQMKKVDCIDSVNSLTQQILDIKTKYYSDKIATEHTAVALDFINGQLEKLLNEANLKIEELRNQIQQKQLDCSIKYGN